MPGTAGTSTHTAAAAIPIHNRNAPGTKVSAAINSSASTAYTTTSRRMAQPRARSGIGGTRTPAVSGVASASFARLAMPAIEPMMPLDSIGIGSNF